LIQVDGYVALLTYRTKYDIFLSVMIIIYKRELLVLMADIIIINF
jgi:hypothetical protein